MASLEEQVQSTLSRLREYGTLATLDGMARYGLPSDHALGVAIKDIQFRSRMQSGASAGPIPGFHPGYSWTVARRSTSSIPLA